MFNCDELWDYIDNYDFSKFLAPFQAEFLKNSLVSAFIDQYSTSPFKSFVNDFWSFPEASYERLKIKYSIPTRIPYSSIIKAFPIDKYIDYLKYFWNCNSTISSVKSNYLFTDEAIMDLSCPIELPIFEDDFCMNCLEGNIFMYEIIIGQSGEFTYQTYCKLCGYESEKTMTRQLANAELRKLINEFPDSLNSTIEKFHHFKCPDCNSSLRCKRDLRKQIYNMVCNRCGFALMK